MAKVFVNMLSEPAYYRSKKSLARVMAGDNKDGGLITRMKNGDEKLFKMKPHDVIKSQAEVFKFLCSVQGLHVSVAPGGMIHTLAIAEIDNNAFTLSNDG